MSQRRLQQKANQKGRQKRTDAQSGVAAAGTIANVDSNAGKDATGLSPARMRFARIAATAGFRWSLALFMAGVIIVALALSIPHEFAFFELGFLFTLSIYDLVLAMLGISVAVGMAGSRREIYLIVACFLGVMAPMMLAFDPIFHAILQSPLGETLFLIAPIAVMLAGVVLWLPARARRIGAPLAAGVVGFSLSLFIGLDDFGIGIQEFTLTAVLGALWILLAPGLLLRNFRGPWLTIPARIIGSWLVVIGIIVMVSLYVPLGNDAPALADPSMPDNGENGGQNGSQNGQLDAPALPPLDPAVEEGLQDAPDSGFELLLPEDGGNPLLNGSTLDLGPALRPDAVPDLGPDLGPDLEPQPQPNNQPDAVR
ncbi:hypothetical protein [Rhizobium sp. 18065]|uniref:hypothetical protein n=1 Tax=Rhizobium sp. 18065 TaxID=2681411 RepID=UPI0013574FC8|nr:hypothetical protein [Rhizobium sp. 18065]